MSGSEIKIALSPQRSSKSLRADLALQACKVSWGDAAKPCRCSVKLINSLLQVIYKIRASPLSCLQKLVPEISSFLSRMTFICSSAAFTRGVLCLGWRQTLSCIDLHVAAWWLRHVCPRSPLTSSSAPRSRAGGHI